jgi:hypothetical protein
MAEELSYARVEPPSADDRGTLTTLGIFYCVIGGFELAGSLMMFVGSWASPGIPHLVALVFCSIAAIFTLSGVGMLKRRFRTLSFVVATCTCLFFPIGTIVGVWTIIVLNKPGVGLICAEAASARIAGGKA